MNNKKVWLITGASRGFGFDITKVALEAGDQVVATVRSNPALLKNRLDNHPNLLVVVLDVTAEDQVIAGVNAAIRQFDKLDILVNNAGYGLLGATEEISDLEVRKQFDTNVFGLLNVTRAVLPHMRSRKSGHIINISSLFGYGAVAPGFGLYGATKYAVEGITEGLALELKPLGIHTTALAPGLFSTDFASSNSYQASEKIIDAYQDTVGQIRTAVSGLHGNQPGDPAKLAGVVLQLSRSENPPLHLPVGKDAVGLFRTKAAANVKEVDSWAEISGSTDHVKV